MLVHRALHRVSREGDQRRDQVVRAAPVPLRLGQQRLGLRAPIALAAGRLRRRLRQELVVQQSREQRFIDAPAARTHPVAVTALLAPGRRSHHTVNERVRRPDVERHDLVRPRAARNPRHVGDPTEVQHQPPLPGIGQRRVVEERSQRSPLAARRNVARAEVSDRRASRALRDDGWIPDLERRPKLRMVRHRLPVGRDGVHLRELHPGRRRELGRCGRKALTQLHVQRRQLAKHLAHGRAPSRQVVDAPLEPRLEGRLAERDQAKRPRLCPAGPLDQRRVHPVRRGPGHEPNHPHGASLATRTTLGSGQRTRTPTD